MADLMVYPKVYLKAARKAVPMAVLLVGQLARLKGSLMVALRAETTESQLVVPRAS